MDFLIFVLSIVFYINSKRDIGIVGLLALITNYFGYGKNETNFLLRHNISDIGILLSVVFLLIENYQGKFNVDKRIKRVILMYISFLLVSALFDIIINKTSILDILKTGKSWICLLTIFSFSRLKHEEIRGVFRLLVTITFVQLLLYYIQYFTGVEIYHQYRSSYEFAGKDLQRGGFPPAYAYFVFLILISNISINKLSNHQRLIFIVMIFGTVVLSLTRSILLVFVLSVLVYYLYNRINAKTIFSLFLFSVLSFFVISKVPAVEKRISEGINDVNYAFKTNYKSDDINENFSFRIFHFQERLDYVLNNSHTIIFGIGFVHESSFKKKTFNIGIRNKETGEIIQLDTGDFSWSSLVLRIGLVGISILIYLFYLLLKFYFIRIRMGASRVFFVYLLFNLIIFSMVSSNIANGFFWPLCFLMYYFIRTAEQNNVKVIYARN